MASIKAYMSDVLRNHECVFRTCLTQTELYEHRRKPEFGILFLNLESRGLFYACSENNGAHQLVSAKPICALVFA